MEKSRFKRLFLKALRLPGVFLGKNHAPTLVQAIRGRYHQGTCQRSIAMSKKREDTTLQSGSMPSPAAKGLHIPVPAVLLGLGMLAGTAHAQGVNHAHGANRAQGLTFAQPINDVYQTPQDTSLFVNILTRDAGNNPAIADGTCTDPSHGFANVSPTGDLAYTPANAFIGMDSFSCTYSDNLGNGVVAVDVFVGLPIPNAAPLPTAGPIALGGLATLLAMIGMRRRRKV
jgi:hypothetical protein